MDGNIAMNLRAEHATFIQHEPPRGVHRALRQYCVGASDSTPQAHPGETQASRTQAREAAGGSAEKLYFDAETGLLVKRDFERITLEDGIVQYEVFYRDYRDIDGIKVPATIEQKSPDYTMILKFAEIRNNAPLETNAFAKPEK